MKHVKKQYVGKCFNVYGTLSSGDSIKIATFYDCENLVVFFIDHYMDSPYCPFESVGYKTSNIYE